MKTLIINGSPRIDGDTAALVDAFAGTLTGETKILSPASDIAPCNDCRHCWTHPGCMIEDEMQDAYRYLEESDNVVIASPIWFSSLSGPALNILSRFQTLYAARRFRNEKKERKPKNGVIILAGGQAGTEKPPTQTALMVMKLMGVKEDRVLTVYALDTDRVPAKEDKEALQSARRAAETLNGLYRNGGAG